tara:strand:- start:694 stop:1320 length:627 start_codon:yes stop_codon:yes gene_type:complete
MFEYDTVGLRALEARVEGIRAMLPGVELYLAGGAVRDLFVRAKSGRFVAQAIGSRDHDIWTNSNLEFIRRRLDKNVTKEKAITLGLYGSHSRAIGGVIKYNGCDFIHVQTDSKPLNLHVLLDDFDIGMCQMGLKLDGTPYMTAKACRDLMMGQFTLYCENYDAVNTSRSFRRMHKFFMRHGDRYNYVVVSGKRKLDYVPSFCRNVEAL